MYDEQSSKQQFISFHWRERYKRTEVLSSSFYIIRQIGTHKTQCVHRVRLRPFVRHNEIDDIQVNQTELYPDTEAIENTVIFDENLPPLLENESENEFEEPTEEIHHGITTPKISDVYVAEVFARRAAIQRDTPIGRQNQTLARSRHPQMEIDEPTDERVSYTPVLPTQIWNLGDSSADSHVNNTCNEPTGTANQRDLSLKTGIDKPTRTTARRCNLRANPAPTDPDHLVQTIWYIKLAMQKQS